jgi:hypothetical protein
MVMDKSLFRLHIFEFIILLTTIVGLFAWNRSESREDYRQMSSIVEAIRQDVKDFHGRLCAIEEKVRK